MDRANSHGRCVLIKDVANPIPAHRTHLLSFFSIAYFDRLSILVEHAKNLSFSIDVDIESQRAYPMTTIGSEEATCSFLPTSIL